jgi:predicted MFS family arabinose efflux permease
LYWFGFKVSVICGVSAGVFFGTITILAGRLLRPSPKHDR